jgi:hypothetical protein
MSWCRAKSAITAMIKRIFFIFDNPRQLSHNTALAKYNLRI